VSFCSIETCSRTLDYPVERKLRRCVEHLDGLVNAIEGSTAESVAVWLEQNASEPSSKLRDAAALRVAADIRAGAWRRP